MRLTHPLSRRGKQQKHSPYLFLLCFLMTLTLFSMMFFIRMSPMSPVESAGNDLQKNSPEALLRQRRAPKKNDDDDDNDDGDDDDDADYGDDDDDEDDDDYGDDGDDEDDDELEIKESPNEPGASIDDDDDDNDDGPDDVDDDDDKDDGELEGFVDMTTEFGRIRVLFLPKHASHSVEFVQKIAEYIDNGCEKCEFYRAEQGQILQGIMKDSRVPTSTVKGICDKIMDNCYGPEMKQGMVGWAGGGTGPDFFVNMIQGSTKELWGQQHTVWGQIIDKNSLDVVNKILSQPGEANGVMRMLNKRIPFTMELEQ